MTELTTTIDTHLAAYAEPDPVRRRALLEAAWAPEGELVDPPFAGRGIDEIHAMVDAVLAHYPAHRFVRTSAVDHHHDTARYGWVLATPDGTTALEGVDVADLDDDGRLVRVVGFFGALPAAER